MYESLEATRPVAWLFLRAAASLLDASRCTGAGGESPGGHPRDNGRCKRRRSVAAGTAECAVPSTQSLAELSARRESKRRALPPFSQGRAARAPHVPFPGGAQKALMPSGKF